MSDPAGQDALAWWLAWVHPAWMAASLTLAAAAARVGLRLRAARRSGARRPAAALRLHLRLAPRALWLLALGFAAGPVSAVWLRGREPFDSAHALAALVAMALFAATGWLGYRLRRGRSRAAELHGLLGVLALLAAAAAFGTGLVLLP